MLSVTVHLTRGPHRTNSTAIAVGYKLYSFGYIRFGETFPAWDQIFVHVLNTVSLLWIKLPPVTNERGERPPEVPSQCPGHTAVLIEDIAYIWGGTNQLRFNFEYYNVLYAFDVDTHRWFRPTVSGVVPEGRTSHSACVLGKVMYVYGGYKRVNGQSRGTNDLFMLDTTTMVWSLINIRGTPPPALWCHSATIIGTKVFVCGGLVGLAGLEGQKNKTISVFDTETNCWLRTPSSHHLPLDVDFHSAFAYNGELYIIKACVDVWKFNPETSWKKLEPKGKRLHSDSVGVCCMVGDRIVVYGGRERNLFILDLSPSMETLCKLAVARYNLDQSQFPHHIRWELAAMTTERIT